MWSYRVEGFRELGVEGLKVQRFRVCLGFSEPGVQALFLRHGAAVMPLIIVCRVHNSVV